MEGRPGIHRGAQGTGRALRTLPGWTALASLLGVGGLHAGMRAGLPRGSQQPHWPGGSVSRAAGRKLLDLEPDPERAA